MGMAIQDTQIGMFQERTLSQFKIINKGEILDYVSKNMEMINLIEKTVPVIRKYFPNNTLKIECNQDPEIEEMYGIIIYVNDDIKLDEN